MTNNRRTTLSVEAIKHDDVTPKNIPTAEYPSVLARDEKSPVRVASEWPWPALAGEKDRLSQDTCSSAPPSTTTPKPASLPSSAESPRSRRA